MKTDVIISAGHNDSPELKKYSGSAKHSATIKSFKLPFGREDEGVKGDVGIIEHFEGKGRE
jgi:type I restriction enzyme R subunit